MLRVLLSKISAAVPKLSWAWALAAATLILTFVAIGYVERDLLRVRALVMSGVLLGLCFVVLSESRVEYVQVHRTRE
jgi:hypothetical protein